mgnify:FL=1|jgi:hypothetical protein|nr:MAG TPA: hypothetical protein [Caudoviricetes sp.]
MNIAPRNTDLEYNMEDLLSYEELLIAQNTRVEEVSYVLLEKNTRRISSFTYVFNTPRVADEAAKIVERLAKEKLNLDENDIVRMTKTTMTLEEYIKRCIEITCDIDIARIVFNNFMETENNEI